MNSHYERIRSMRTETVKTKSCQELSTDIFMKNPNKRWEEMLEIFLFVTYTCIFFFVLGEQPENHSVHFFRFPSSKMERVQ